MTGADAPGRWHQRARAGGGWQAWHEWGDSAGRPVLYCHGFPATGHEAGFADEAARRTGIRLIAPDRPGFGGSSIAPFERIVDWAGEAVALLDHLAIERLPILGVSGGAPYALATAAAHPDRIGAVATIAGLGPLEDMGASHGMSALGRMSIYCARHRPYLLRILFAALAGVIRVWPTAMFRLLSATGRANDGDQLREPASRAVWIRSLQGSVVNGSGPGVDEMLRYVRPWGFPWPKVTVPVTLWHGTRDPVVPPEHARHLAQSLADSGLHWLSNEGHFSAAVNHIDEVLARLSAPR